jgi:hypothetical protein
MDLTVQRKIWEILQVSSLAINLSAVKIKAIMNNLEKQRHHFDIKVLPTWQV